MRRNYYIFHVLQDLKHSEKNPKNSIFNKYINVGILYNIG